MTYVDLKRPAHDNEESSCTRFLITFVAPMQAHLIQCRILVAALLVVVANLEAGVVQELLVLGLVAGVSHRGGGWLRSAFPQLTGAP